jgi:ribosomal protein S18 acetylase RimI-like enzyme
MAAYLARVQAEIRPARYDDAEFLVELSDRAFRQYLSFARTNMIRMMRNPACAILVAEEQIRLGFAVVHLRTLDRAYGPWSRPTTAHLDAIAVRPSVSGRGVGRRLLAAAEELARARGAISMSLLTAEKNVRAQRLFRSGGFRLVAPLGEVYEDGQKAIAMLKAF